MKSYDIVVFGATGFTGKYIVHTLDEGKEFRQYRLAIAGRSSSRLEELRSTLKNPSSFRVVIANVDDEASLARMCADAKVVLNCVGPYRFFGEAVVKACIAGGAHYLDISGEPEFMERVEFKYTAAAKEKNLVVVSACGFDSVVADIGALFTVASFPSPSFPTMIDSFLSCDGGGGRMKAHYTTYESAVHGFGSAHALSQLRKQRGSAPLAIPGPRPKKHGGLFFSKETQKYCFPFMGSDAAVVRRSQTFFSSEAAAGVQNVPKPIHYSAYFTLPSFFWSIVFMFFGVIFSLFAKFAVTRKILLKFPKLFSFGFFSHEGPSAEEIRRTTFSMLFVARGYSSPPPSDAPRPPLDSKVITQVSGPEPGYVACSHFITQCANVLLNEGDKVPRGVLTTAAAFGKTTLIDRLKACGISFKVISSAIGTGKQ